MMDAIRDRVFAYLSLGWTNWIPVFCGLMFLVGLLTDLKRGVFEWRDVVAILVLLALSLDIVRQTRDDDEEAEFER